MRVSTAQWLVTHESIGIVLAIGVELADVER
jgi:hypothetical protein